MQECGQDSSSGYVVACENCLKCWHLKHLNPPLEEVPEEKWYCADCMIEKSRKRPSRPSPDGSLDRASQSKRPRGEEECSKKCRLIQGFMEHLVRHHQSQEFEAVVPMGTMTLILNQDHARLKFSKRNPQAGAAGELEVAQEWPNLLECIQDIFPSDDHHAWINRLFADKTLLVYKQRTLNDWFREALEVQEVVDGFREDAHQKNSHFSRRCPGMRGAGTGAGASVGSGGGRGGGERGGEKERGG